MKISKTTLLLLLLAGALIAVKLLFLSPKQAEVAGQTKATASNVTAFVLKPVAFENKIQSSGTISANEEVELHPEASGKITKIYFKEGEHVGQGELLLKLNDTDLLAQLRKLESEIRLATEKESRQKKLLDIKAISQDEYDASLTQMESLRADADVTRAQIQKTEVRAPFAGVVGLKSVSEGTYVSPSVKIASIQQLNPIKIDFSVPEKYAGIVKKGGEIQFTVSGRTDLFKGKIYAMEPKIDLTTRSLLIRATCSNESGKLVPGAFARIELVLHQSESSLFIPTEAIIPELKGQKVFLCREGKSFAQKVETGVRTDTQVEITSGLQPGDTVITTGIMQMKPGSLLKITELK